ncbi:MAG: hypothetical protein GXY92_06575 [Syntrophomonadaceae bacterium]|nr:hypothetical protein [Syntrophomonadaceae bacterium]
MAHRRDYLTKFFTIAGMAAALGLLIISLPRPLPVAGTGIHTSIHDLDQDGQTELYVLANQGLIIGAEKEIIWRSPPDWRVASFHVADVTHDRHPDLLLLVWKKGSFGRLRPFWHTGRDAGFTCHLYVFNLANRHLKPVWMSSALDRPIDSITITDIDDDGRNELLVTEGWYWWQFFNRFRGSTTGDIAAWEWQDWGFYRVDR